VAGEKRQLKYAQPAHSFLGQLGNRPKIAILKPGGLGDFLAITPALRALRQALPLAHTTLIARPGMETFCRRYTMLDDVVACPPFPGVNAGPPDPDRLQSFIQSLRTRELDLAIQWAGNGKSSNQLLTQLGARWTAGFWAPGSKKLDLYLPFDDQRHEVQRFLDNIRALGIPLAGDEMEAPIFSADLAEAQKAVPDLDGKRWLGINPSADDFKRRWPAERFAATADRLLTKQAFDGLLLLGGPGQEDQTAAVAKKLRYRGQTIDLAGKLSLGGLAAVFTHLDLLISTDSGPAHLAAAVGTPTVVIYGAGPPMKWSPVAWVWQRPVADWHSSCRQFVPACCEELPLARCLDKISVNDVLTEANHLLRLSRLSSPPQSTTEAIG
jgi:ADP-heptose:LPS heptosyltransferase